MIVHTSITHPLCCLPRWRCPTFYNPSAPSLSPSSCPSASLSGAGVPDTELSRGPLQPTEGRRCPIRRQESCLPSKQQPRLGKREQGRCGLTVTLLPGFKWLNPEHRALCGIHSPECFAGIEFTRERAESLSSTAVSDLLLRRWRKHPTRFSSGCFLEGTRPGDCQDCEDCSFVHDKKNSLAHTHTLSHRQRRKLGGFVPN